MNLDSNRVPEDSGAVSALRRFVHFSDPLARHFSKLIERALGPFQQRLEDLLILQGRALALANAARAPLTTLEDAEFKVFSQFGEDGILQYLIRETGITRTEQVFVEFGVQDYLESNTRYLLQSDNWRGLILDGSEKYMASVRARDLYWRHDLTARSAWIDRDNINQLIIQAGIRGTIGLLSVDIDGNDYWVWERIEAVDPVIVVLEWNSVFGPEHAVTVPYDPSFVRQEAHASRLYWGASIRALASLGARKGYALVGSNTAGNNVFFVRRDRLGRLGSRTAAEAYVESRFRDSRDEAGRLDYLAGAARREAIQDLPVVDVETGETSTLRRLDARLARRS
jgi:hypothetical protein